ncbi:hypothetical protein HS99_0009150 [Kitasatospora aureofaciens]|uniref:Uncharacterized protein n=1 Tax=Kitasatospora aureofaciens TaxID=1894 RepID=A0A1E7N2G8_KITAU|nr:hypothetical protein B6264_26630 [Kitasatospora aureofaciens]OEV34653.1 hypothetical protein HS99_0009150 [Kitasatospora aureofaciens]
MMVDGLPRWSPMSTVRLPAQPGLLVVHVAYPVPDMPGTPGLVTACGIDTASMVKHPWQPFAPGSRWYPPYLALCVCSRCDRAVRSA